MIRRVRPGRLLAGLATFAVATLPLLAAAPAQAQAQAGNGHAKNAKAVTDSSVQVRVTDVSPSVPARSSTPTPLLVRLTLTNTTSSALRGVTVSAVRGDPIGNQRVLDQVVGDTTRPSNGLAISPTKPVSVDLPAHGSVPTVFATTISVLNTGGICQCVNAVYPLYFTATADGEPAGSTATFLPAQLDPPTKTKVAWVWPLIDRPHRLTDETLFTDDDLATTVGPGGRLDHALQVLEQLPATMPMTVVTDPELLDELEVMASGQYRVRSNDGSVPGTGQAVAGSWLDRFAALLTSHRSTDVSLTPYADPDVQSLARDDLSWATKLPTTMRQRVTLALAGRPLVSDVAWPAGGALQGTALDALARAGAGTVVLDGSALRPATRSGIPVAVARLRTENGSVTAAATSPAIQRQVAEAVGGEPVSTTGSTVLPYLLAETTIRSVQSENNPSYAVLAPPRYVDPDPARAVRTIEATSSSAYASAVDVRTLSADRPSKASKLRSTTPVAARQLPAANLDADTDTTRSLDAITSMVGRDQNARTLVAGLREGAQRVVSSAWRPLTSSPFPAGLAADFADGLSTDVTGILDGVHIVIPSSGSGSYTLGSRDSSLPITVENTLAYPVSVDVTIATRDGLPGYQMGDMRTQRIAANSKQTVQVPSRVERSGRIPVEARLTAPTGRPLGVPAELYVRSTVFGTIGIVITFVAGGVLVVALMVRFGRRLLRLRRKAARTAGSTAGDTPAGTAAA